MIKYRYLYIKSNNNQNISTLELTIILYIIYKPFTADKNLKLPLYYDLMNK